MVEISVAGSGRRINSTAVKELQDRRCVESEIQAAAESGLYGVIIR
jgi:hypothetical protein